MLRRLRGLHFLLRLYLLSEASGIDFRGSQCIGLCRDTCISFFCSPFEVAASLCYKLPAALMRVSLSLASVAGGGDWDWDLGYSLHIAVASLLPSSVLGAVVRAANLCNSLYHSKLGQKSKALAVGNKKKKLQ